MHSLESSDRKKLLDAEVIKLSVSDLLQFWKFLANEVSPAFSSDHMASSLTKRNFCLLCHSDADPEPLTSRDFSRALKRFHLLDTFCHHAIGLVIGFMCSFMMAAAVQNARTYSGRILKRSFFSYRC